MRQAGVVDGDARGGEADAQLLLECGGDLLDVAPQRDGVGALVVVLHVVVGVHAGDVAKGRLGLHRNEALVVVDVEQGLGGVLDAPDHDGRDLDGVAHLVVYLEGLAVERACARRDLGAPVCAQALGVERVGPAQALVTHGAHVLAKQDAGARLARLQREEAVRHQEGRDEERQEYQEVEEVVPVRGDEPEEAHHRREEQDDVREEHEPSALAVEVPFITHVKSLLLAGSRTASCGGATGLGQTRILAKR